RNTSFSRDWSSDVCSSDLHRGRLLLEVFCPDGSALRDGLVIEVDSALEVIDAVDVRLLRPVRIVIEEGQDEVTLLPDPRGLAEGRHLLLGVAQGGYLQRGFLERLRLLRRMLRPERRKLLVPLGRVQLDVVLDCLVFRPDLLWQAQFLHELRAPEVSDPGAPGRRRAE